MRTYVTLYPEGPILSAASLASSPSVPNNEAGIPTSVAYTCIAANVFYGTSVTASASAVASVPALAILWIVFVSLPELYLSLVIV